MKSAARGFTLLEVAIVLVIAGLLLGGLLAAQELISTARLRNLLQQQDGLKAAYYAFHNRYGAAPGDYARATANIRQISTVNCNGGNGDGDGLIETANNESTLVWEHLSRAGFLNVVYTCAPVVSSDTSPTNAYGSPVELIFDANYAGIAGGPRHNLKTGANVSSRLLSELDRKVDDGNALDGVFRAQTGDAVGAPADCYDAAGAWRFRTEGTNCGGALLL
jgi:prepilin-type N-terminal cleavage/methylation domain-containing protein